MYFSVWRGRRNQTVLYRNIKFIVKDKKIACKQKFSLINLFWCSFATIIQSELFFYFIFYYDLWIFQNKICETKKKALLAKECYPNRKNSPFRAKRWKLLGDIWRARRPKRRNAAPSWLPRPKRRNDPDDGDICRPKRRNEPDDGAICRPKRRNELDAGDAPRPNLKNEAERRRLSFSSSLSL